jgi:hypothetical protein
LSTFWVADTAFAAAAPATEVGMTNRGMNGLVNMPAEMSSFMCVRHDYEDARNPSSPKHYFVV